MNYINISTVTDNTYVYSNPQPDWLGWLACTPVQLVYDPVQQVIYDPSLEYDGVIGTWSGGQKFFHRGELVTEPTHSPKEIRKPSDKSVSVLLGDTLRKECESV